MKRINKKAAAFTMTAALFAGTAVAGGIDSKTNLSTGYHRNPSRNTECERPEAALYNIAGTGFMKDGFYVEAGNQFVFKNYSNTYAGSDAAQSSALLASYNGNEYEDKEVVFFYPDANIVYKHGNFSVFGAFAVAGGGGTLNYEDGTSVTTALLYGRFYQQAYTTAYTGYVQQTGTNTGADAYAATQAAAVAASVANNHSLEVYSVTYGETIGAAYKINDMFSVSAAVRLLESQQDLTLSSSSSYWVNANGQKDAGYEAFGFGVGGIFGVHAKPIEGLDLALQYKTITKMDVEFKSMEGDLASTLLSGATEGDSYYNDMPAELNFGAGYRVIEPLYINTSFNYYFNKQADISNALAKDSKMDYDNSWELGCGADWTINEKVLASAGFMYSNQGSNSEANNLFAPVLDCINIGLGVEVKPITDLALTAGAVYAKYFEKDYSTSDLNIELNKSVFLFSIGATYRFDL